MGQGVKIENGNIVNKNPATGEVISHVPCTPMDQLDEMVAEAKLAAPLWAAMEAKERIQLLKKGIENLAEEATALQQIITKEMGKPFSEAEEEVEEATDKDEFLDLLEKSLQPQQHGSSLVVRQALGVVTILSPWNFPADEILLLMLPALGSGNCGA